MADEKQTLLVFSLGPVQSFIAAARKTEDLWSGSYLLSHLTGVAIRSIQEAAKDKGTLVFLVYPGSRSNNNNNQLDIASLPNRIILRIIHEVQVAAELAESAAKAVRQEFIKLGEYAINKVFDDTVSKTKMITMLEEQIDTLLEIYWALEPVQDERDYDRARLQAEKRMAAVKNFRPYKPYRQNGLVCTLCGEQTALTENGIKSTVNNYAQMKINLVNTWSKRSREYQGVLESLEEDKREGRIKEGEGLCSICLTKRLTRQYFKEHSSAGDKNRYGPFPSIHDIADQSGYYAVIMMDGDDMGKWVSGEKAGLEKIDIAYQQKLSSKLESFASRFVPQEVKKSKGELIYSGGDDVLAFVPQREVISLAKNLYAGRKIPDTLWTPSILPSMGIRLMCTLNRLKKILTLIASPPMNKGSSTRVISITLPSAGDTTNPAAWGIVLGGLRKKKRQNKLTIAKTTPAVFQPITKQASDNRAGTAINTHPSKATISLCFIFIFLPACCRRPSFINATLT